MSLKRIPAHVENQMCAAVHINNFKQAIEELVYNSLDAESTSIAIRVFIEESLIQVVDNGFGICYKDFPFVGRKYLTSKFENNSQTLAQRHGYKGSSLASLIDISENVKITSRYYGSKDTYTKSFRKGKEQDIYKTSTRPSKGTTIEIRGYLYNLHIQKKSVIPTRELSHIKEFLELISLVHCNTSISLRDDSENEIVLQINKTRDICQTLLAVFEVTSEDVQELQVEKNDYKIHAFIEKLNSNGQHKKYSFVYVNERFISKFYIHNVINGMLKKYLNVNNNIRKMKKDYIKEEELVNKSIPYYFVFIKCPRTDYTIASTSNKTAVEFKNREKIDTLVKKLIDFYTGDYKVKQFNINEKKKLEAESNDTRKQIEKIMQKFLGSSLKRRGPQMRVGIKGKNVKRKEKTKQLDVSLTKIVQRVKSKVGNTNNENSHQKNLSALLPRFNDGIFKSNFLKINNNDEKDFYKNNVFNNSKSIAQVRTKSNDSPRVPQDPFNNVFKSPSDIAKKRTEWLWNNLKNFINNNYHQHMDSATDISRNLRNTSDTNDVDYKIKKCVSNYAENQKEMRPINTNKMSLICNNVNDVKTSHDLIRSISENECCFELQLGNNRRESGHTKQTSTINTYRTTIETTNQKTMKHKLSYESHSYKDQYHFITKKRKFISNKSCNNFESYQYQSNKSSFTKNSKKYEEKTKNSIDQPFLNNKYSDTFLDNKNYPSTSTLYTVESVWSNYNFNKKHYISEKPHNSNNLNHELMFQTFTSNIQQTSYTDLFISTIDKTHSTTYDIHSTHNCHVTADKNCQVNKMHSFKEDIVDEKDPRKGVDIIFISEPNSKYITPTDTDNINKTIYQTGNQCTVEKSIEKLNTKFLNYTKKHSIAQDSERLWSQSNNFNEISRYFNEEYNPTLCLDAEKLMIGNNASEINTPKEKETDQSIKLVNQPLSSDKLNVNVDNTNNFQLNTRFSFMPKGMSQITRIKYTKTKDISLHEEYYEDDIYKNFVKNIQVYSEILQPNVSTLMHVDAKKVRNITCVPEGKNVDLIFDSQSIKEIRMLRQVDNKFIGTKMYGKLHKSNDKKEFLVLFDQHAVDERIRLEKNIAEYFDGQNWISVSLEALPVKMSKEIILYLHNHKEKFTRFGLDWTLKENNVFVTAIPKAVLGKNERQIEVIMKAVTNLISEQVEAIKSLKGNVNLYPKSIMDLVMSEACRYAIKFGDVLTDAKCVAMLSALSECKLPFQCAHGRPVMAVMMELPSNNCTYKVNIDKIKNFSACHK